MAKKKIFKLEDLKEQSEQKQKRGKQNRNNSHQRNNQHNRNENRGFFAPSDTSRKFNTINPDNVALFLNKRISISKRQGKYDFTLPINERRLQTPGFTRYYKALEELQGIELSYTDLQTDWKLAIGLGGASIYETGITLHHVYGIPYIPGSAIKGSVRSYVILTKFDGNEKSALEDDEFVNIFGSTESQGRILFFDAFSQNLSLKKDILNPHYKKYYDPGSNPNPPADYLDPTPISFLTVEGVFRFAIGSKKEDANLLEKTSQYLRNSLIEFGIGAKTAVGYGYFKGK